MKKFTFLLAATCLLFSCAEQGIDREAEAEKLLEHSREWAKAAMDKDVEKIVSYWAEDAVLMSPDEPALVGSQALREMVEGSMGIQGFEVNWEPKSARVSKSGDMGYVLVHNYFQLPDSLGNVFTIYGKGVEIWEKQEDGNWRNVVDIYNRDPTMTSLD